MARVAIIEGTWHIRCPACNEMHGFIPNRWTFNGDLDKPTFNPSMLIVINPKDHKHYNPNVATSVCHSVVEHGRIRYLSDCTHSMAGRTVDLPEIS